MDEGYSIKRIEDAIVLDLQELDELAEKCKTIAAYGGQLEALVSQVSQLPVSMPAVYILYAGSDFTQPANQSYDDEMSFSAVVVAKDLRGRDAMRVGIYEILELLKGELIGNDLGLEIEPFHPQRIDPVMMTDKFSIYTFTFQTNISVD